MLGEDSLLRRRKFERHGAGSGCEKEFANGFFLNRFFFSLNGLGRNVVGQGWNNIAFATLKI